MDSLPVRDILLSCKNLSVLEAVTEQYERMAHILNGLRSAECEAHIGQRIRLKLLEVHSSLLNLRQTQQQITKVEEDCETMARFVKDCRLYEMVDDMLIDVASRLQTASLEGPQADQEAESSSVKQFPAGGLVNVLNVPNPPSSLVQDNAPTTMLERVSTPKPRLVTEEELNLVPSYLRGRISVNKLNETYEMLREVTDLKYQLLTKKSKKTMTNEEREAITRMRAETVSAVRSCRFITEADILLFKGRKLPKVIINHLAVLRTMHRIREIRDKNLLRIVIEV
ncbi:hypothetical protein BIW11_05949 [Tropilaelaps mercedesae]|uniref:SKA complex subunit 1 n=1 Tax=Tropilaelaps mercedesae TaxID=418985 RepID=A0A1V9Y0A8_9ACAR|nr:hypothetical protein BIW11_05949 [Tropilaelaps mercedesae]